MHRANNGCELFDARFLIVVNVLHGHSLLIKSAVAPWCQIKVNGELPPSSGAVKMASEKDPSPQFTGGVVFAVNLNIERIVAQGSELLVGEFKSSPDLSVGGASISRT